MSNHGQEQRIPTVSAYDNPKVEALLAGQISISNFTERDFRDLAVAAADQAGAREKTSRFIGSLIDEDTSRKRTVASLDGEEAPW